MEAGLELAVTSSLQPAECTSLGLQQAVYHGKCIIYFCNFSSKDAKYDLDLARMLRCFSVTVASDLGSSRDL